MDHILVVYRTLELFNASLDRGMCHNVYKVHRGRKNIYKTHQGQKNIYKAHIPMLGYMCAGAETGPRPPGPGPGA